MKKMESIKSDVFKKFENDEIFDMSDCKGKAVYETGSAYIYDTLCSDAIHTYANGDWRLEYRC